MTGTIEADLGNLLSVIAAANVIRLRKARKWSQAQLAERLSDIGYPSLTMQMISNIETGRPDADGRRRRQIEIDELAAFGAAFDVEPWSLVALFACVQCNGTPPAGFDCRNCGAVGIEGGA